MYENMNKLSANDVTTKEKWSECKLMMENIYHVSSCMKEQNDKQITKTRNRKRGICQNIHSHSELNGKRNQMLTWGIEWREIIVMK